jgi:2,4-dienoyl-CoA reductase (NADPH2)
MANECLGRGEFDYWEVCRPLLADPELIHKAAEGRLDEVRRCIGSLNCLSRVFRDLPYSCTMNPALGHEVEPEYAITPAAVKKKIMVIGAGPSGMEFAITAARRGHDVTVFERGERIGGSLLGFAANDLARPDDLLSVVRHYEVMAKKHGVKLQFGTEANAKFMRSALHQYDVCIVAAGARVDQTAYAYVEGRERIVDALDVAAGRVEAGKRVLVLGGNKVGLVLAESLAKRGAEVTVAERGKRVAEDVMPTFKWRHTAWLEELEIRVHTQARLERVSAEGAVLVDAKGARIEIAADTVIAAGPRRANQELFAEFEWMVDELHGCGDALMARGLDAAIHEGYRLGVRI